MPPGHSGHIQLWQPVPTFGMHADQSARPQRCGPTSGHLHHGPLHLRQLEGLVDQLHDLCAALQRARDAHHGCRYGGARGRSVLGSRVSAPGGQGPQHRREPRWARMRLPRGMASAYHTLTQLLRQRVADGDHLRLVHVKPPHGAPRLHNLLGKDLEVERGGPTGAARAWSGVLHVRSLRAVAGPVRAVQPTQPPPAPHVGPQNRSQAHQSWAGSAGDSCTQRTLQVVMSLRFAASVMDLRTFFSSNWMSAWGGHAAVFASRALLCLLHAPRRLTHCTCCPVRLHVQAKVLRTHMPAAHP